MLAPHISVVNLGCRVNRVESDRITADLMRLGFAIVEPQDADLIEGEASKMHAAVLQLSRLTTATCGQLQAISRNAAYVVAEVGLCQHERIANVFGMIRDYADDRTDDGEGIAYSAGFAYEDEAQQQRNRASILARTRRQRKDGEA